MIITKFSIDSSMSKPEQLRDFVAWLGKIGEVLPNGVGDLSEFAVEIGYGESKFTVRSFWEDRSKWAWVHHCKGFRLGQGVADTVAEAFLAMLPWVDVPAHAWDPSR